MCYIGSPLLFNILDFNEYKWHNIESRKDILKKCIE